VACPAVHLSTASMFADPLLVRNQPPITFENFQHGERSNAFTPVARARSAEIDALFGLLAPYATAQLTGSGAAVFCAFDPDDPKLESAARTLPDNMPRFIAQGLNCSSLHAMLAGRT